MRIENRKMSGKGSRGFTSIELVVVIVVLGLLVGAIMLKNPFSVSDYSSIAASQLVADIQYVQMRAMGLRQSQNIAFQINAGDYGLYSVAGAQKRLPGTVTITGTSFSGPVTYNSMGEPDVAGTISLSGGQTVRIYASTGRAEIQ